MKESNLVDWTRNCQTLKAVFGKARRAGVKLNVRNANEVIDFFNVIQEKEDYAIISKPKPKYTDGSESAGEMIYGYGSDVIYWITK